MPFSNFLEYSIASSKVLQDQSVAGCTYFANEAINCHVAKIEINSNWKVASSSILSLCLRILVQIFGSSGDIPKTCREGTNLLAAMLFTYFTDMYSIILRSMNGW